MPAPFRILVLDGVSPRGVSVLSTVPTFEVVESKSLKEDELTAQLPGFDALVVRSQTKVGAKALQASPRLKVVGRAGVGVDNVDVPAATRQGVVVMNTPGGNTVSTAEHSFSMLMSLARHIPQANASVRAGEWDRKSFQGVEINNKILGIIGMGRIGTEVARRAIAFGMRVMAYDPYLALAKARSLQVELYENLGDMLPHCDFLTLHMPMTPETKGILDKKSLPKCKKGVRIVNCARGGLVDELDLAEAIQSGQVAGAALDVFEVEPLAADHPLRKLPQVIMTPHLGASTAEAQESVGIEIAESIRELLLTGSVRNAVNMPNVDVKTMGTLRPYLDLSAKLGLIAGQLASTRCESLSVSYSGKIKDHDTSSVSRAALKGFLTHAIGADVNEVNVLHHADNLGLKFAEYKLSDEVEYTELITVLAKTCDGRTIEVGGSYFGNAPRIVRLNGQNLEARPEGVLLILENRDRPGIVGWVGTLLGKHKINIASMSLGRSAPGSSALSVLSLDSMPGKEVVGEIRQDADITSVDLVQL
jgi:D-3-phosphoglycerate dehydrogenase / 2-oxoglutarate reductase